MLTSSTDDSFLDQKHHDFSPVCIFNPVIPFAPSLYLPVWVKVLEKLLRRVKSEGSRVLLFSFRTKVCCWAVILQRFFGNGWYHCPLLRPLWPASTHVLKTKLCAWTIFQRRQHREWPSAKQGQLLQKCMKFTVPRIPISVIHSHLTYVQLAQPCAHFMSGGVLVHKTSVLVLHVRWLAFTIEFNSVFVFISTWPNSHFGACSLHQKPLFLVHLVL